jgi:hypothetical protein
MVEITHLGGLQEVIDSNIGGIGMSDEQNNALARIIYKKIPTNCEFEVEFKARTKNSLTKNNTKLDNVQATYFRIRNLLAEFRELDQRFQSFAPVQYKYEDKDPNSNINKNPPNQGKPITFNDASAFAVTADTPPDTCNICGVTNRSSGNCRSADRRLKNKSTKSSYYSEKGTLFRKAGHDHFKCKVVLPGHACAAFDVMTRRQ